MQVAELQIENRRVAGDIPHWVDGRLRLNAEARWVLRGPESQLLSIEHALPETVAERVGDLLLVNFGNLVGRYVVPHLGTLEIVSGKWSEADYEQMLGDISAVMVTLPFAAGDSGSLPYDRRLAEYQSVVYQAFVYLRHILSDAAPREMRLPPALEAIRREPHYVLRRESRQTQLALAARVQPSYIERLAAGAEELTRAPPYLATLPLARALRGHLPPMVEESRVRRDVDTAENRFVKNFLELADAVVGRVEGLCLADQRIGKRFWRRTLADCAAMKRALGPYRRGVLWDEVGRMTQLPAGSTVLQRRRGYSDVYRHFLKLRATSHLPLTNEGRDLLEVKDIATLFEMWCYFQVVDAITSWLGEPVRAREIIATETDAHLANGFRVEWAGGVRCHYNLTFSRSRKRRSYSVQLRPDIVVELPGGDGPVLHALDAKFKIRPPKGSDEGLGSVKREDVYKMHAYRDAIPQAKSVWALYPGDMLEFYPSGESGLSGVGAIPLTPGKAECLRVKVGEMLGR